MDISKIVDVINNGELAIIPTDTVYGIVADATNYDAVKKVFLAKKRDFNKPLIIMVSSLDMLNQYIENINDIEKKLIDKYWPGKMTILLKKNNKIPNIVTANGELVGVRYPNDEELIKIMNEVNKPLISTSANIAGDDTITNIDMIEKELYEHISYIYDGGIIENNPSTLVKVDNSDVIILRKGDLDITI